VGYEGEGGSCESSGLGEVEDAIFRESEWAQRHRWARVLEIPERGRFHGERGQKIQLDPTYVVHKPVPTEVR